jgi:hypothetical protein
VSDLFHAAKIKDQEIESVLADVLFEYFDAHERLTEFMKWVVAFEIQKTGTREMRSTYSQFTTFSKK